MYCDTPIEKKMCRGSLEHFDISKERRFLFLAAAHVMCGVC